MRYVVITGGPDIDYPSVLRLLRPEDYVLCADSGALHARHMGLIPSRLTGDLDSIDAETLKWIRDMHVPMDVYPVDKDMTDTELCLRSVPDDKEIILVCSFSGRTDHVFSNYLLAGRLAAEGRKLMMTDGITSVFPVAGPTEISIPLKTFVTDDFIKENDLAGNVSVSLFPVFSAVRGVSTEGLMYPLHDAQLIPGSSFSVSNRPKGNACDITIRVAEGVLLILITRQD